MALTIEDGTQVTGSDSYVTRVDYIAHALTLGITIANTEAADVQLRKAAEFIGSHEANLNGERVTRDQSMAYPRSGLYIDGWYWTSEEIPRQVILCQLALALDINAGVDLYNKPVNPNLIKKRKRIEGVIDNEFAVPDKTGQKLTRSSKSDALLSSLLKRNGLMSLKLVRS